MSKSYDFFVPGEHAFSEEIQLQQWKRVQRTLGGFQLQPWPLCQRKRADVMSLQGRRYRGGQREGQHEAEWLLQLSELKMHENQVSL